MAVSLSACGGADTTPFAQADIDAAVAAANAAAATAQAAAVAAETAKVVAAEADATTAKAAQAAAETAQAAAEAAKTVAETAKATAEAALATQTTAITDAGFADLDALIAAYVELTTPVSTALTTEDDVVNGTAANDTITGTFGTGATIGTDIIIDAATSDADTLTLTGSAFANTASTAAATIRGIEAVNVVYDTLTDATLDAAGIQTSSVISVSNVRDGSGADLAITNITDGSTVNFANFVDASAIADADGDLTVSSSSTGAHVATTSGDGVLSVAATSSTSMDANSGTGDMTVTVGTGTVDADSTSGAINITGGSTIAADTTTANIVVNSAASLSVTANTTTVGTVTVTAEGDAIDVSAVSSNITVVGSNDTANVVTIDGVGTADSATIATGSDLTIANGGANAVETVTVNASEAVTATVTTAAADTYVGDANTTFAGASTLFAGTEVSGAELSLTTVAAGDFSEVTSSLISFDAAAGAGTYSFGEAANVDIATDIAGAILIDADDGVTDAATTFLEGTLNLTLSADVDGGSITVDNSGASDDGFDTVNITVTEDQTPLTLIAGDATVNLSGANDVTLDNTSTADSLNASGLTGVLVAEATANLLSITSGSGADVITSDSTSADVVVSMGDGNDTLDVGGAVTGTFTAGNGTDTLTVTGALDISAATFTGFEIINTNTNNVELAADFVDNAALVINGAGTLDVLSIGSSLNLSNLSFATTDAVTIDFITNKAGTLGASSAVSITGSDAIDTIDTQGGNDTILGGAGDDDIDAGTGADYIDGGAGDDTLDGEAGDDIILGGAGGDTITGQGGADTIDGGAGADTITGGAAADAMTGGAGDDNFIIASGDSTEAAMDTVTDYQGAAAASDNDTLTINSSNDDNPTVDADAVLSVGADINLAADVEVGGADADAALAAGDLNAIVVDGILTLSGAAADVAVIDTLSEWIDVAELTLASYEAAVGTEAADVAEYAIGFEFGGDTYVVSATDGNGGADLATDDVIMLDAVSGIDALSLTAAANTILIA